MTTHPTETPTTERPSTITAPTPPAAATQPAPTATAATPAPVAEAQQALVHYDDRARIASYRRTAHRPPAAQAGAIITLLVGLMVVYAQWALYTDNAQAQSDANWALLFMMVSTGAALRILMGNPGRHLVSTVAIMACGVGFVLRGFLIGGGEPRAVDAVEVAWGVLLLLGGGLAAAWPALKTEPPAPVSPS